MSNKATSLLKACTHLHKAQLHNIDLAYSLAQKAHEGQTRGDGSPYISHPLEVAIILAEWGADQETIIAGLLHDVVEDTSLTLEEVETTFGPVVGELVEGVTKFTQVDFAGRASMDDEVETLRRLFEVMRKDIRVVIIKLADRLHNLRTISGLKKERQKEFAEETLDTYYKIAYHLGMNDYCREVTNICVPFVHPEKAAIRERHWKEYLNDSKKAVKDIEVALEKTEIHNVLESVNLIKSSHDLPRPDNEDESVDRAYYVVIIAKDVDSCYKIFRELHQLYRPVRRRFHDYIASPPEAGYQSLHTTVIGPHGRPMQIRIRTAAMDAQVHHGVLLNAFQGKKSSKEFTWLQRTEQLDISTRESSDQFWDALQSDILQKTIQVTVKGKPIAVPKDATILDVAYFYYGAKANHVQSAHQNGQVQSFANSVKEDDVFDFSFNKDTTASYDWLKIVKTKVARNQIVEVLKEQNRDKRFSVGQRLLQEELDHFNKIMVGEIPKLDRERVANYFHRESFQEVVVMIGEGAIRPSEVVEILQGEKAETWHDKPKHFSLAISIDEAQKGDVLTQMTSIARLHDIVIQSISLETTGGMHIIYLKALAPKNSRYADFIYALERHSWISSIRTLLSRKQKAALISSAIAAMAAIGGAFIILSLWKDFFVQRTTFESLLLQLALILPPLLTNFYFLQMLRHYVVALRNERWTFGITALLNIATFVLISYQGVLTGAIRNVLPILSIFILFMFYIGYKFITTEKLFISLEEPKREISKREYEKLWREKVVGYAMRLCAVTIWGLQPIYVRYTPANTIDPLYRIFFTGVGVLIITVFFIVVRELIHMVKAKRIQRCSIALPKSVYLFNIIIGYILFTYFLNASLQFTTSTNFILFNSFSPVLALLVGAILWRSSIPYLQEPHKILWVFLIFILGSIGSTMIIYSSWHQSGGSSLFGDMLGLLAMAADTLLVVSQIRYIKIFKNVSSLVLNFYVFIAHILTILPVIGWQIVSGQSDIFSLSGTTIAFGIGAGLLAGIGQILNYETFRRIDGYIAFLMFNISILITFAVEVLFLGKFIPSWILLLGGIIIIASTVLAETINTLSQRKGL